MADNSTNQVSMNPGAVQNGRKRTLTTSPRWTGHNYGGGPMFGRILVPLDGSGLSAKAIPYTAETARRFDGKIELLRVVSTVTMRVPLVYGLGLGGPGPGAVPGSPLTEQAVVEDRKATIRHREKQARRYLNRHRLS